MTRLVSAKIHGVRPAPRRFPPSSLAPLTPDTLRALRVRSVIRAAPLRGPLQRSAGLAAARSVSGPLGSPQPGREGHRHHLPDGLPQVGEQPWRIDTEPAAGESVERDEIVVRFRDVYALDVPQADGQGEP